MSTDTDTRSRLLQTAAAAGYPAISPRRAEVPAGRENWERFAAECDLFQLGRALAALSAVALRRRQAAQEVAT